MFVLLISVGLVQGVNVEMETYGRWDVWKPVCQTDLVRRITHQLQWFAHVRLAEYEVLDAECFLPALGGVLRIDACRRTHTLLHTKRNQIAINLPLRACSFPPAAVRLDVIGHVKVQRL